MKKNILFILFFLVTISAQCQFAPVGAEWWYSGNSNNYNFNEIANPRFWTDHVSSTADTIIDGKLCQKLNVSRQRVEGINQDSFYVSDNNTFYVYDNVDTVFIYNESSLTFTPLYVFNAQINDTICLPIPDAVMFRPSGYSTFCFVVDSIKLELFDTTYLKSF